MKVHTSEIFAKVFISGECSGDMSPPLSGVTFCSQPIWQARYVQFNDYRNSQQLWCRDNDRRYGYTECVCNIVIDWITDDQLLLWIRVHVNPWANISYSDNICCRQAIPSPQAFIHNAVASMVHLHQRKKSNVIAALASTLGVYYYYHSF